PWPTRRGDRRVSPSPDHRPEIHGRPARIAPDIQRPTAIRRGGGRLGAGPRDLPLQTRGLVRVRRTLPVPRAGGRIPPDSAGPTREIRGQRRPDRRGEDRPGLSAPARFGRGPPPGRGPREASLGDGSRRVSLDLPPFPVPPRPGGIPRGPLRPRH